VVVDDDTSGVYLRHRQSIYFVTAWHVLYDPQDDSLRRPRITLRSYTKDRSIDDPIVLELDLTALEKSQRILFSKTDDLAAVAIGDITYQDGPTVRWNTPPGVLAQAQPGPIQLILGANEWHRFDETKVSNDVYIFGYPKSVGLKEQPESGRPVLRKGALAEKNPDTRHLIVDALAFPGNSGGPVVEVEQIGLGHWEPRFIGIVVESILYRASDASERTAHLDNSAYAIVAPVDSILDLIEKHPSALRPER
jgi:hypothetical protein